MSDTMQFLRVELILLAATASADGQYELTEKLLNLADLCKKAEAEATA